MDREKELQLATAGYNWLKASPIVTVATLFFIAQFGIGFDSSPLIEVVVD